MFKYVLMITMCVRQFHLHIYPYIHIYTYTAKMTMCKGD